jgi:hypothetical protein
LFKCFFFNRSIFKWFIFHIKSISQVCKKSIGRLVRSVSRTWWCFFLMRIMHMDFSERYPQRVYLSLQPSFYADIIAYFVNSCLFPSETDRIYRLLPIRAPILSHPLGCVAYRPVIIDLLKLF